MSEWVFEGFLIAGSLLIVCVALLAIYRLYRGRTLR